MADDSTAAELLSCYVLSRDEGAFAALVRRFSGLVFGTALRVAGGRVELAEEATQRVFIQLAREAPRLLPNPRLGGWLHAAACGTARSLLRSERRRLRRETVAHSLNASTDSIGPPPSDALWNDLAPRLDEGLRRLPRLDREALIQRYFEGRTARAIAEDLGVTPEAAQKRLARALDRLRGQLHRRGAVLPAAALATAIANRKAAAISPERIAHWTDTGLAAAKTVAPPGAVGAILRAIRGEPWAFAGGIAAVAVAWLGVAAFTQATQVQPSGGMPERSGMVPPGLSRVGPRLLGPSGEDLFARLVVAAREPASLLRQWRIDAVIAEVPSALAAEFVRRGEAELDASEQTRIYPALFDKWAQMDPTAAGDYLLDHDIDARLSGVTMGFLYGLFHRWLERDANAVALWVTRHFSEPRFQRDTLQGNMGAELASAIAANLSRTGQVDRALGFLEGLPPGPNRDRALSGLADDGSARYRGEWTAAEQTAFLNTLAGRLHGPLGTAPLQRSLALWAQADPTAARSWIDGLAAPEPRFISELGWLSLSRVDRIISKDQETGRSKKTWVRIPDPDRAVRADQALVNAAHLPRAEALREIVVAWNHPKNALLWLRDQTREGPAGEADAALSVIAIQHAASGRRIGSEDPPQVRALSMCDQISDPQLREDLIGGIVRKWVELSPGEASEFLEACDWPTERRVRLQRLITPPSPSPQ